MAMKLPGAEALGPASSGRSGKPIASYDTTAIGRGAAQLGAGIASMGNGLAVAAKQKSTTVDQATAFETQRRYLEFTAAQEKALADNGQQTQPGAFGFTESYRETYKKDAKAFFASVPDDLKPQYDVKLFEAEDSLAGRANTFEREQRAGFYTTKVSEGLKVIEDKLYRNPKAFDANLAEGNSFIDNIPDTDVSPIAKDTLRREWKKKAQLASLNGMPPEERIKVLGEGQTVDVGSIGSGHEGAKALLRNKEGFRATPYWDVNAHRIGFGSDTVTREDGSVVKVVPGMTITKADAERDLERRAKEFAATAIGQVGAREWGALPPATQAALTSVTYNYGSLPNSVVNAVKSGNVDSIASAVEGLQGHNNGVNAARRRSEAAMIRGKGTMPGTAPSEVDPRFADMTYGERETVIASSAKDISDLAAADAAQAKAAYTLHDQTLGLDIEMGKIVSESQIVNDASLDPGDILKHLKAFRAKQDEDGDVRDLVAAVVAGDSGRAAVNGFDTDERKVGDKAYTSMIEAAPEQAEVLTEAFVQSTGYIPKSVQARVRQGVASTDPAELAAALSSADVLERTAPISFGAFEGGAAAREKLGVFRHYVNDLGMSGADAAQRIITMNDPAVKVNRDVLKPAVPDFLKTLTVGDVTNEFDPSIWAPEPGAGVMPIQTSGLVAEYREIAEAKFYETGGDAGAAKALALADLKMRWNVSTVSGSPNLMRTPPELYYPPVEGSHTYLRDDALETATSFVSEAFPGRTVENVAILPTDTTRADIEAGRPPRYRLFYQWSEGGQARFDEVFGGAWGLDPATVEDKSMTNRQKSKKAAFENRAANAKANEIKQESQTEADQIIADPTQPDWLKAMRAQNALTLGEMNSQDRREARPEAKKPPPASDGGVTLEATPWSAF
jgi:GH24 family phage-related lysozyme (muramidase)